MQIPDGGHRQRIHLRCSQPGGLRPRVRDTFKIAVVVVCLVLDAARLGAIKNSTFVQALVGSCLPLKPVRDFGFGLSSLELCRGLDDEFLPGRRHRCHFHNVLFHPMVWTRP